MTANRRVDGDGTGERGTVVISSPEELIASIPAMLGFPPGHGSVVVMCGRTADGGQGPVVRMDVDGLLDRSGVFTGGVVGPDGDDEWDDLARDDLERDASELDDVERDDLDPDEDDRGRRGGDRASGRPATTIGGGPARGLALFCSREGVSQVHLVVVHEDCADRFSAGLRAEDAAAVFEYWLGSAGTRVVAAYGVGEFAEGAPWVDLFGMVRGVQLDPDCTEIAAVHAYDGRVRAGSRDEIDRLYRSRDPEACEVDPHGTLPVRLEGAGAVDRAVGTHDDAVGRMEAGEELDDDELAEIGRSLLDVAVRDEVYRRLALQGLSSADGRRLLWWSLARRRPGRERSVALVLLGAAAYFSGSGVHARSALEAAVAADPANSLARLLLHGLDHGLAPDRLRRVAAA